MDSDGVREEAGAGVGVVAIVQEQPVGDEDMEVEVEGERRIDALDEGHGAALVGGEHEWALEQIDHTELR